MQDVLNGVAKYEIELECDNIICDTNFLARSMILKCTKLAGTREDQSYEKVQSVCRDMTMNYKRDRDSDDTEMIKRQKIIDKQKAGNLDDNFFRGVATLYERVVLQQAPLNMNRNMLAFAGVQ
jgi:hypothetical protein